MPFNDRLKHLREVAGLTQDSLAKAAGLTVSTVAKLERPGKEPAWTTAVKLADALGVRLDDFRDAGGPAVGEAAPDAAGGKPKSRRGKGKGA